MVVDGYAPALHAALTREYLPLTMPQGEEFALVAKAAAGDAGAFGALYDLHVRRVYRQCYYRTGNRVDAEDLVQQTFLQAWQALPRYRRTGAPFLAWLLTISHNLAVSTQRKTREVSEPDLEVPAAAAADPEAVALDRLDQVDVRLAILQLKSDRQQVILLRFIDGYAVDEVAAALGKSANHVRVLQHRALADLRRLLQQEAVRGD
ncbi:MAG TPA: RNA polymerase sigma factor [Chloroflexota bacterium]|jgi:RNA polymerase sigma-70 factor (ECF subfamily)|nr:RNA polymerase sigma factor [Chloroflexota bacterium]